MPIPYRKRPPREKRGEKEEKKISHLQGRREKRKTRGGVLHPFVYPGEILPLSEKEEKPTVFRRGKKKNSTLPRATPGEKTGLVYAAVQKKEGVLNFSPQERKSRELEKGGSPLPEEKKVIALS